MRGPASELARRLRRDSTDAESRLWSRLRAQQVNGVKFRRQHSVGPFIVDFCSLKYKLVIEVDGGQHNVHTTKDRDRDAFLVKQGYRVLRFWNHQALGDLNAVLDQIWEAVKRPPHPTPLPPGGEGYQSGSQSLRGRERELQK